MCAESQWIDDLRWLVHPPARDETIFVMIKVYLDESGIHGDAMICTVAGYAASWKKWKAFIPAWNKVLRRFGLDGVGFHATEFFKRRGTAYKGWKPTDTIECFNKLVSVINAAEPVPVGGCVVVDLFRSLNENERRYLTGAKYDEGQKKWLTVGAPSTPYHLPVQLAIIDSVSLGSETNKVHFIHDQQYQYEPLVLERFRQLQESLPNREALGNIVFSSRMDAVPLQAADMLAFQATKYAELRIEEAIPNPMPSYEFRRLMERPNKITFFDHHILASLLDRCPKSLRTPSLDR